MTFVWFMFLLCAVNACPKPYNLTDEIYIAFEKMIVPKIEVLLNQNISKRSVSRNVYEFPESCKPDILSKSRMDVVMGRIRFLSSTIENSRRYARALTLRNVSFPDDMEHTMRTEIIKLGDIELERSENPDLHHKNIN